MAVVGYAARVNPAAFGLSVTAFVRVGLRQQTEAAVATFEQAVLRLDAVQDCFMLAGDGDYLLRVVAADLADYEGFLRQGLHQIGGIASILTSFSIGSVKESPIYRASAHACPS